MAIATTTQICTSGGESKNMSGSSNNMKKDRRRSSARPPKHHNHHHHHHHHHHHRHEKKSTRSLDWQDLPSCSVSRRDAVSTLIFPSTPSNDDEEDDAGSPPSKPSGIVLVGGRSDDEPSLASVELFQWASRSWKILPSLTHPRCGCCMVSLEDRLYVMGGIGNNDNASSNHGENVSTSCESYNITHHEDERRLIGAKDEQPSSWKQERPMSTSRWYAAAVSFPIHGDIIVLGGRDETWQELASVEAYDTKTQEWYSLSPMSSPRFGFGAVQIAPSKLIAVGGYDGTCWSTSTEIYDYETDTWSEMEPMPEAVEFCVVTNFGHHQHDLVLVTGTTSGGGNSEATASGDSNATDAIYCYSISQNKWTTISKTAVGCPLSGSTMVSIGGKLVTIGGGSEYGSTRVQVCTNLKRALHINEEDATLSITTSPSTSESSSHHHHQQSQHDNAVGNGSGHADHSSSPDPSDVPWWASPTNRVSNSLRQLIIPQEELDQVSLLEDADRSADDFATMTPPPIISLGGSSDHLDHSGRSSRRSFAVHSPSPTKNKRGSTKSHGKRNIIHDRETTDALGKNVIYSGSIHVASSKPHGEGKMLWVDTRDKFEGSFRNGRKHGYGKMEYRNGDSFEGMFVKDSRHGHGIYRFGNDGRYYEGEYHYDSPEDLNGTMTWANGTVYVGSFVKGCRTGPGIQRFESGVRYQGDFVDGKYHGYGVCEFVDGKTYRGDWIQGKAHGQGQLTDADGQILHDGKWEADAPVLT